MLELPTDLVIDPVTTDRLVRQLAAAPASVAGVVAARVPLPAGSSTRVHAEWQTVRPLTDVVDAPAPDGGHLIEGAVLLRPGIDATTGRDSVHVARATLRLDHGAVVHHRELEPHVDLDADAEGRSPFPWRPVVVFLGTVPADRPDLEPLLDALLDADVEPRLAVPTADAGPRRHAPCAPSASTIAALGPDVIVALDPGALDQAPAWCTRRETTIVDMTGARPHPDGAGGIELVSWQIDRAPTRLRARVDLSVAPVALAQLVNRLAAGPQPAPPPVGSVVPVRLADAADAEADPEPEPHANPPIRPRTILAIEPSDQATRPLLTGLTDRLALAGHRVDRAPIDGLDGDSATAADVVLISVADRRHGHGLVTERSQAGRATVLVIEAADDVDPDELAEQRVAAVSSSHDVVDELRHAGVTAHHVPTMTPTARLAALREAGARAVPTSGGVIGWTTSSQDVAVGIDEVVSGVLGLLTEQPDAIVEVVPGTDLDAPTVPAAFVDHPQVLVATDRPDAGQQARWSAHVTFPHAGHDVIPLLEAAHCGVPSVLAAPAARLVGGLADPTLVIGPSADPEAWAAPLRQLLDGSTRAPRSRRARDTGEALDGRASSDRVVARFLGWLDREAGA